MHSWDVRARVSTARSQGEWVLVGWGRYRYPSSLSWCAVFFGVARCRWVIVRFYSSLLGPHRVVFRRFPSPLGYRSALPTVVGSSLGRIDHGLGGGREREQRRKRTMILVVVRFRDVPPGHPTLWVPPNVPPRPNPLSSDSEPPTSLWKGEGRVWLWFVLACWGR